MSIPTVARPRQDQTLRSKRNALILAAIAGCIGLRPAAAQTVQLGTAESFAILGGSTVTNTGPSTIFGDLGVSPGTAITGFGPGIVAGGTIHVNDGPAVQAHADARTAYNFLAGLPVTQDLTGLNLGGRTLTPGVYRFSSSAQLTGGLILDGQGRSNPLFVFQIGTTLTTASASSISAINGADGCDVFFQVGTSATLGTGTMFAGTIIASASDTLTTGASVMGRVIALDGAVTLDTNNVTVCHIPAPSAAIAGLLVLIGGAGRRSRPGNRLARH